MAEPPPNVRLSLAGTPENVVLVREMLSGVAEAINLDSSNLNDIRIAVTEACNNVVVHAYEGEQGPLEVEVHLARDALKVIVRDQGIEFQTSPDITTFGIGMHVIRTLAHRVEYRDVAQGGTEVWMEFAASNTGVLEPRLEDGLGLPTFIAAGSPTTTTVSLAPIGLARTVLPRLMSALAARAHFSTDRISDTQLLADALLADVQGFDDNHLSLAISAEPRNLELRIGPLSAGRAQQLVVGSNIQGVGQVIEKLADYYRVMAVGSYEVLNLHLLDPR